MWIERGLRFGSVLLATAIAATCVQTSTDRCDDGSVCPDNTQCRELSDRMLTTCVTDAQLAACELAAEGDACTVAKDPGTCFGGACYPAACGDRIQDRDEVCDDGNRDNDDGCSDNCRSREQCGDGDVDLGRGEQCDDGGIPISGDGCSSRCLTELDFWQQVTTGGPGFRIDPAVAADPSGGVLLLGGSPSAGSGFVAPPLGDTWRWEVTTWRSIEPPQQQPSPRARAAMGFDPVRKRTVLFGGGFGSAELADTWEWDGYTWTERSPVTSPQPRQAASMACSPSRCVLVGGVNGDDARGDVWTWNGTTWTQMTGTLPPPRYWAAMAYDSFRDVIVLYGGHGPNAQGQTVVLSDTWELSTVWTPMPSGGPIGSAKPRAAYDPVLRKVVVAVVGSTWHYASGSWQNLSLSTAVTGGLAFDPVTQRIVSLTTSGRVEVLTGIGWGWSQMFEPSGFNADSHAVFDRAKGRTIVVDGTRTFSWDGVSWEMLTGPPVPVPSSASGAMAFDEACDSAVHVGGGNGSAASRATASFNEAWTPLTNPAITPRAGHAMTYDVARDAVVVFGGVAPNGVAMADTWELTGTCGAKTWVERMPVPASSPIARTTAAMTYDPVRKVVVMFGGRDVGVVFDETWEWDGQWKLMPSATKPPARYDHALAYDPRRRAVVMFGGTDGAGALRDTWSWNGIAWKKINVLVAAPARSGLTMAQDNSGTMMVIGGQPSTNDIWRLQSSTTFEATERCEVATADEDGDGLPGCADPDCGARCRPLCPLGEDCGGPHCGDLTCSAVEDYLICPADCPAP
ncbi:MAG: hypothetical protein H0T42_20325 [Deltaproteobacteria bacterium]|nr:hypothetical protein [Deltaproteobacteria bacterium]